MFKIDRLNSEVVRSFYFVMRPYILSPHTKYLRRAPLCWLNGRTRRRANIFDGLTMHGWTTKDTGYRAYEWRTKPLSSRTIIPESRNAQSGDCKKRYLKWRVFSPADWTRPIIKWATGLRKIIQVAKTAVYLYNKKAVLSQRRPCDVPYIWVPWKYLRPSDYTYGYFSQIVLMCFCSDRLYECAKKIGNAYP